MLRTPSHPASGPAASRPAIPAGLSLHTAQGRRKYLTPGERARFITAAASQAPDILTLCLILAWTGCRISEALGLTHADLDQDSGIVSIHCLKKRRPGIVHEVPVPIPVHWMKGAGIVRPGRALLNQRRAIVSIRKPRSCHPSRASGFVQPTRFGRWPLFRQPGSGPSEDRPGVDSCRSQLSIAPSGTTGAMMV
jgi:hypothetical protein